MKKLFTLVAMAMMAVGANAQEVVYEVDWTQQEAYYNDVWFPSGEASGQATVSVDGALIIDVHQDAPETANYWEPQVPMIAHMGTEDAPITEGGQYVVKFDVNAPAAGKVRLDFCSWTEDHNTTKDAVFDVAEGDNDFEIEFLDYPGETWNAMIFYQGGKLPGIHKIKKVQVIDLEATAIKSVKNAAANNNVRYNLAGQKVDASYKGVVLQNGKKFIQK